jgi:transcriptional regulator with XRE-family HTH domain
MNPAWMPLPDDLPEPARRLTEQLRAVKDARELSLADLARLTHFSKASWERWLNGKRLITEQALAGLIAAVDCDAVLLNALLESALAEAGDTGPEQPDVTAAQPRPTALHLPAVDHLASGPETAPGSAPRLLPRLPRAALWGVSATVLALALAGAWLGLGVPGRSAPPVPTTHASPLAAPFCEGVGCAGKDPQSTGCGTDVSTLQTTNDGKVILYIHYSARCRAAWAALTDGAPGDTATITTSTGEQETALIHWGYDNYSAMVDASDPGITFHVCGTQPAGRACTSELSAPTTAPTPAATPK